MRDASYGRRFRGDFRFWNWVWWCPRKSFTHNIRFYWTPTEASWLNRIESHLTALRKFALDNTGYRSHEEQQEAIESYLRWHNGQRPIDILEWERYCWQAKKTG